MRTCCRERKRMRAPDAHVLREESRMKNFISVTITTKELFAAANLNV